MMNLIRNPSPAYKGTAPQPKDGSGMLSQLVCYLFGGSTPAYKGKGQTAAKQCGPVFFPNTPVYKEPVAKDDVPDQEPELHDSDGDEPEMPVELGEANGEDGPIECMGPVTIVVR